VDVDGLRRDRERVGLVLHHGLGDARAQQLGRLGIETRADLARWSPDELASALRRSGASGPDRFLERRVRVWLTDAARRD
jgi:predicted flap endonuclease-1-like 5' DNA nuclease